MIIVILLVIIILLSIAFFTLLERKILGGVHIRQGPGKISVFGLFQPFADGLKLFFKETILSYSVNKYLFSLIPLFMLWLMFMIWLSFSFLYLDFFIFSLLYVLMISSLGVYGVLGSGWASNSKYALLGAYRSVSQVVSYEVSMMFFMIMFFIFMKNFSFVELGNKNYFSHYMIFGFFFFFFLWLLIILAELNRAPFDFSESESELVSGFNVEYGSIKFAFLFLSEYGNMIFMAYISVFMFFSKEYFIMLLLMFLMVFTRSAYPRFRYDSLMYLNWKFILPLILVLFLFLFVMVSCF